MSKRRHTIIKYRREWSPGIDNLRYIDQYWYSAVPLKHGQFSHKYSQRPPIARPLGRGMECLLWTQHLIDILPVIIYVICYNTGPRYNGTQTVIVFTNSGNYFLMSVNKFKQLSIIVRQGWRVLEGTRFLPRYLPVNTGLGKTGFGHPKWEKLGKTQLNYLNNFLIWPWNT